MFLLFFSRNIHPTEAQQMALLNLQTSLKVNSNFDDQCGRCNSLQSSMIANKKMEKFFQTLQNSESYDSVAEDNGNVKLMMSEIGKIYTVKKHSCYGSIDLVASFSKYHSSDRSGSFISRISSHGEMLINSILQQNFFEGSTNQHFDLQEMRVPLNREILRELGNTEYSQVIQVPNEESKNQGGVWQQLQAMGGQIESSLVINYDQKYNKQQFGGLDDLGIKVVQEEDEDEL